MSQHFKNILAVIIAFASAMAFVVVLVRLKNKAAQETAIPKTAKYSLDGAGRRIAGGCSFVAAALAVFWLMQRMRGPVPRWGAFLVDMLIIYSSLGALFFGLVGIRRELSRRIVNAPLMATVPSVMWAVGLTFESHFHGAPELARAGLVTFAVTVGLAFAYALVGKRLRPRAAQPAP